MKRLIAILLNLFIVCCMCGQDARAEEVKADTVDRMREDFIEASLLICEPSNANFYSVFGHSAIRLNCPTYQMDHTFSYASDDIEDKFWSYLAGKLKMGLLPLHTELYVEDEFRTIREYPLNLPPHLKSELWRVMDEQVDKGFNRPYDCIKGGCSVMQFLFLDEAIKACPELKVDYGEWPDEYGLTIRELVTKYTESVPWSGVIYNVLASGKYVEDSKLANCKKLMYPAQLIYQWQHTTINGRPILGDEYKILVKRNGIKPTRVTPIAVGIILLLMMILSWMTKMFLRISFFEKLSLAYDYLFLGLVTLLGIFLAYLVFFSELPHTEWNRLLIPFNPLLIVGWKWRKYWALYYLIGLVMWSIVLLIMPHMQIITPIWLVIAAEGVLLIKQIELKKSLLLRK